MGRREVVFYVCDWCHVEAKPDRGPGGDEYPPESWKELEYGTIICDECVKARQTALDDVRHACLNSERMGKSWPCASATQEKS